MSTARARANHKLYLARILLDAWQAALEAQEVPARTLHQAFATSVRAHLLESYGWFLLEICQPASLPPVPPHHTGQLPAITEGKAMPGEIREFTALEREGWLAELLAERDEWATQSSRRAGAPSSLASPETTQPGPDLLAHWAGQLESLFDRMGDSLDEY